MKLFLVNRLYSKTACVFIALLASTIIMAADQRNDNSKGDKLDELYINLSDKIYKKSSLQKNIRGDLHENISSLHSRVKYLNNNKKDFLAITEIYKNEPLIKKNIDNESIYYFIKTLLNHNEWIIALRLFNHINKEGDKSLISNVKYIFAKYHFNRNEWHKTIKTLSGINSDLGVNEGHYALIMNGVTFQKLKKHREALKYYNQVPITSKYYNYAQLNKATVYIKQGWWSDAHIIINKLLISDKNGNIKQDEFINRLYLVLGYSFLQQEYYRESRNAFRDIQKTSQYTNRALLGISLAAANQGDNIGALNILNVLQEDKSKSLTTEESYLLLPYIYERIGQNKTASASYSIALNYYRNRINEVNNVITSIKNNPHAIFPVENNTVDILKVKLHISNNTTIVSINNLNELINIKSNTYDIKSINTLDELINEYIIYISSLATAELEKTLDNLKSYLNQSQYGIARLYDNSRPEK